jgi:hypothetical protein
MAPKNGSASAGIWFARFDPADPTRTFGIHRRSATWSISTEEFDVRIEGTVMCSGRAEGSLAGGGHEVSWKLEYPTGGETYQPLPSALYRRRLDLESRRYLLTGRIEAPAIALLRARYEDPDGTPRYCHNSAIASCRLALFERRAGGFDEIALLESRGTTHAEWAGRTPAPQVEREFLEASSASAP